MIRNYFLITLRSLMKNKTYIFINVFGMGIAIACCIVAYLNWDFNEKFDAQHEHAASIYRVQFWREFQGQTTRHGTAPMPMGNIIKQNFADVDKVVRLIHRWGTIRVGDELFSTRIQYADSGFFEVFTVPLKQGTYADYKNKSNVFINDEVARKYFGREDVVGERITQIIENKPKEFIVGGVFQKFPSNSSFDFEIITLWDNYGDVSVHTEQTETNWSRWNTTFLYIKDPSRVTAVSQALSQFIEPQNKASEDFKVSEYYLENFVGNAKRARIGIPLYDNWLKSGMPHSAVVGPSIMAILLLLLACFNFTNTSIAVSSRRLKEIGIRKVLGGLRRNLVFQFMGENLLLCALAMIVGVALAELLVPAYDSLWPWLDLDLNYSENAGILIFIFSLLVITAIIAGSYPSFYITSFEPVGILKGKLKIGGTNWFTRVLLCLQFIISLMGIVMGIGFIENAEYQKDYDLGYATSGVISVWVNSEGEYTTYRDALSSNKDIKFIGGTRHHVANWWDEGPIKYNDIVREVDILNVGEDYLQAMDIKFINGRNFKKDSETDRVESVIVSEKFVQDFGWTDDPVGKRLVWKDTVQLYVIGIVKDIYSRALWAPIRPTMIRCISPAEYRQVIVSTTPDKVASINDFMKEKWKEVFPNGVYSSEFIEEELQETHSINNNVIKMFLFMGIVAAIMSVTGLYTLVSLNILKKMKEIGVRKVLGASLSNITGVINLEFAIILTAAGAVGSLGGYLLTDMLMSSIWSYYLKMNFVIIGLSLLIMFVMAALTVGFKTVTTASMNPVHTLRDE